MVDVDPTGVTAAGSASGTHYEVRLPAGAADVRVFARGAEARPADTTSIAIGGVVLLAMVGPLVWK